MTVHNFAGGSAALLHPSEEVRAQIAQRLAVLGVTALDRWPDLHDTDRSADFLVIDIDRAHDEQLPWGRDPAPMPVIGLIGSESPGRLDWALRRSVDAFLPLAATSKIYSALVIARAVFDKRVALALSDAEVARRATLRAALVDAVLKIRNDQNVETAQALKQLRAFAMAERLPLEDAALRLLGDGAPARRDRA